LLGGLPPSIPGGASACVLLLDSAGNRITISSFEIGWRTVLTGATMEHPSDLGGYLIDISISPVINGRPIANEYFAVRNNRVQLVRLEDDKSKPVQNSYEYPNSQIGPIPDAISIEDWRALLESSEPSEVLSALVFLGGKHFERNPFPENIAHESSAQVQHYKDAIGDQQIWALITKLESSGNKWIREAA
jgi:hypothetical protein